MSEERNYERWIWTELIAFDNTQTDLGVGEYLSATGFAPTAISLLLGSPDFVLGHRGGDEECDLPPEYCSRDGHDHNPQRRRQVWTNHQLRRLLAELHTHGVEVFLSFFTLLYHNQSHHEWLSDHPETWLVYGDDGPFPAVDALGKLADGSLFEDYFVPKLVETLEYYGFDGWHGADGWGPLPGYTWTVSFSDGVVSQFAEWLPRELPAEAVGPVGTDLERIRARAAAIWRHESRAWIEFHAQRWEQFWRKALTALHAAGMQGVMNAGTRAPLDTLYFGGVDYRRIVAAGIDGLVLCTVAAGLALDPRPGAAAPACHYGFLAALLLERAALPEARIVFLQNVHDVVEEWDALHHAPALLEREIYALANVYLLRRDGEFQPAADGPLACLGDGLSAEDWRWMRERWSLAFSGLPRRVWGVTLLWSGATLERELDDYLTLGGMTTHALLTHLMLRGVPVQAAVNPQHMDVATGPLLVLNDHLLAPEELEGVWNYRGGPVILVGREREGLPQAGCRFEDVVSQARLSCRVYGAKPEVPPVPPAPDLPEMPPDRGSWPKSLYYWSDLPCHPVSEGFLRACAQTLLEVSGPPRLLAETEAVTLMVVEQPDGKVRVALKNQDPVYRYPEVEMGQPVREVQVLTPFPAVTVQPQGSRFHVRVPALGVTVVDITLEEQEAAPCPASPSS